MTFKILDLYFLSDEEIDKMEKLIELTKKLGVEHSGRICSNFGYNELKIINICSGNEFSVGIPKRCKSGYASVGLFHTHVPKKGKDILSIPDIENHVLSRHVMDCLGACDKIFCFTRKKVKNFKRNVISDIADARKEMRGIVMSEESSSKDIEKSRSKLSLELTNKYFDRIMLK